MSFYAFGVRVTEDAGQPRLMGLSVVKCTAGVPTDEFLQAERTADGQCDEYQMSGASTGALRGDRMWIAALTFCAQGPVVLLCSQREREVLDRAVEEFGYAPFAAGQVVALADLARIAAPRQAVRDSSPPDEARLAACALWRRLAELPEAAQNALFDGLASPAWQALLSSAMDADAQTDGQRDGVKVIGGLAFRPARAADANGRSEQSADDLTGSRLARESVALLREIFAHGDEPFEIRPGQNEMIRSVSETLTSATVLAVEAGTGTGKSLAYLLPAALYARQTGRKVVVATHTTALQEQLRRKEWPEVARVVKGATAVVMKGRNHYVCLRKAADFVHGARMLDPAERDFFLAAGVWLTETETGDVEEFAMSARDRGNWQRIQSETETCLHRKCAFFRDCHYFRAKARAAEADIVVTNHSLVISDLVTEHRVLPAYQHLIVDEAHHLEGQATAHLGAEVTWDALRRMTVRAMSPKGGVLILLRRHFQRLRESGQTDLLACERLLEQCVFSMNEAEKEIDALFGALARFAQDHASSISSDGTDVRLTSTVAASSPYANVLLCAKQVSLRQQTLVDIGAQYRNGLDVELDESTLGRCEDAFGRLGEFAAALAVCADVALQRREAAGFVSWISVRERDNGNRLSLHLAPLSVADILRTTLFARKDAVILASATLSVGGLFEPALEPLGLLEEPLAARAMRVKSPFDYRRQVLFCVPTDMPEVRDALFTEMVAVAVQRIAAVTRGRAMVLFTANQMMRAVAASLREPLQGSGIRLLVQGEDEHRKLHLIEQFRAEPRAVLLGVSSFWEGIDIRGDDLSCLVIVKLPFPVPSHPLVEARSEMLKAAGKSPFAHFSLPKAVIRFTQGFGRLVRTQSDRGVVFVLDKRLVSARYGRTFLASLPELGVVTGTLEETCDKAGAFFAR